MNETCKSFLEVACVIQESGITSRHNFIRKTKYKINLTRQKMYAYNVYMLDTKHKRQSDKETPNMLDKENDVQGIALYAQFHKPGAMTQLIVTPDGYDEKGEKVLASIYRRIVTSESPKKQWRSSFVRTSDATGVDFESGSDRAGFAEKRMGFASQLFDSLLSGKWELHKEPIYLEVSKKDLTDIRDAKTPTKLLYRVNQSREAMSFETEIPAIN